MKCPFCRSAKVYRSRSGNQRLPWLLRAFIAVGRCHHCERRFWVRGPLALRRRLPEREQRSRSRAA